MIRKVMDKSARFLWVATGLSALGGLARRIAPVQNLDYTIALRSQ